MASPHSRVFLSGSPVQAEFLRSASADLTRLGFVVLAPWFGLKPSPELSFTRWTELLTCDIIAVFDMTTTCIMEAGAALILGHPVVGVALDRYENDETLWLPSIDHYTSWDEALALYFEKPATLHIKRRNK